MKERANDSEVNKSKAQKMQKEKDKNVRVNDKKEIQKVIVMGHRSSSGNSSGKWYEEAKYYDTQASEINYEEVQKLRTEASSVFNEAVTLNNSKTPRSLSRSDYAWIKTIMSKGTRTDKIAAYTLLIQDSPLYSMSLLKNMVEMVKVGKNKECFMAIDTLCELFLNDLLPPDRKLMSFADQPVSRLDEITSGNIISRKRKLLLWFFEDQLKCLYGDFVTALNKIAHNSVDANKEKVITVMCKLLEGNPENEIMLLNNIVNKLGDPSHKVGSKVIYALTKLLEIHPNMKEVVLNAVEKIIFRTNISKRAQYYSVCFLSQFCLFKEDSNIAKQLISIYLSLFKACTKTGDVDSRMMSALLTGVNRAYPFAKEDLGMLKDHICTIYKVIHLSHANVSVQALSLVYLISDYSNTHVDRFYSVLYKKMAEPEMFKCSHQAMFLSLIYKALKKDQERARTCALLKRLLQICTYVPVQIACGILIMISEVLKVKKDILRAETKAQLDPVLKLEESDDDVEHYVDIKEEEEVPLIKTAEETTEEKVKTEFDNVYNIKQPEELKVWTNPDKTAEGIEIMNYNPFLRNPLYSGGDQALCYELFILCRHFHPTISLFASKIIKGERIIYNGDPLQDFTLIRFLDKFSFKNPKMIKSDEEKNLTFSKFGRKKYYSSATVRRLRANTADYLNHSERNIPVDEFFLYRYLKEKNQEKGARSNADNNSDLESIGSDEFDEMLSGWADGKKGDIDFSNEVGKLSAKEKKSKSQEESDSEIEFDGGDKESEDENDIQSEGESIAEDFNGDELDDFKDNDLEIQGSDVDEDELEAELEASGIKLPKLPALKGREDTFKKSRNAFKNKLFASADEFSELLEEDNFNAGGSEAFSNKDRAGVKQLKWEDDRDRWIHKKNFRSKNIKGLSQKMKHRKMERGRKKKRF